MKILVVTMAVIIVALVVALVAEPKSNLPTSTTRAVSFATASQSEMRMVAYRVRAGDCLTFSLTYNLPTGTSQRDKMVCPGDDKIEIFTARSGDSVYLSAQNVTNAYIQRPFSCVITVDGREVAAVQSVGFAKIATCSGLIP